MKLFKFALIGLACTGLMACETMGASDTATPYSMERTATHEGAPTMKTKTTTTEKQVVTQQCPASEPTVCPTCTDVAPLQAHIRELQAQLAQCREGKQRVQDTYRETLIK